MQRGERTRRVHRKPDEGEHGQQLRAGARPELHSRPADTQIDSGRRKTTKKRITITFSSPDEPNGATFDCQFDNRAEVACDSGQFKTPKMRPGTKHTIRVTAADTGGNEDPTPAVHRVKRRG